jgi:hypothetical protein
MVLDVPKKTFKYVGGRKVPVYAKGMTKSEYVIAVRNKANYDSYNKRWRSENRESYNKYHREYYQLKKNKFDTTIKQ